MSEPDNLINVEDETPPEPAAAPPVVAAPADEGDEAVDVNGTPITAGELVDKSKASGLIGALKSVRTENKELRAKAAENDTLRQQLAQAQGQLHGFQQVTQQLRSATAVPTPTPADEEALAFARGLDLFAANDQGQPVPDLAKARAILGIIEKVADQRTQRVVGPVVQATARDRAITNYQWALQQKDPQGKQVSKAVIDEIWKQFPVEMTANPDIARTLVINAFGMERLNQQPTPAAPPPVNVTEAPGANPTRRPAMSALEQAVAKEKNITVDDWAKHTANWKAGHTTVLED